MPSLTLLLQHCVLYGGILSALIVLSFVGAAYLNPEIWLPDYPPDIRERFAACVPPGISVGGKSKGTPLATSSS